MVRPTKKRKVRHIPEIKFFKPAGVPKRELSEISLTIEEIEAIRLKDKVGLTQQESADKMEVSRPTFQRVLSSARKKIAEALIDGKAIRFQGGDYNFSVSCTQCGADYTPHHGRKRHSQKVCPECD